MSDEEINNPALALLAPIVNLQPFHVNVHDLNHASDIEQSQCGDKVLQDLKEIAIHMNQNRDEVWVMDAVWHLKHLGASSMFSRIKCAHGDWLGHSFRLRIEMMRSFFAQHQCGMLVEQMDVLCQNIFFPEEEQGEAQSVTW